MRAAASPKVRTSFVWVAREKLPSPIQLWTNKSVPHPWLNLHVKCGEIDARRATLNKLTADALLPSRTLQRNSTLVGRHWERCGSGGSKSRRVHYKSANRSCNSINCPPTDLILTQAAPSQRSSHSNMKVKHIRSTPSLAQVTQQARLRQLILAAARAATVSKAN